MLRLSILFVPLRAGASSWSSPAFQPSQPLTSPASFAFDQFGGHLVTPIITVLTPLTAYLLYFGCHEGSGCPPPVASWLPSLTAGEWSFADLFDARAFVAYYIWYAFVVACWAVLPGDQVEGTLLRDGTRKSYKINGASTLR